MNRRPPHTAPPSAPTTSVQRALPERARQEGITRPRLLASRRAPTWLAIALGALIGALLTVVGLARAGRLAEPERPDVIVNLAQTLEVEHRRVDILVEGERFAEAITALERLRELDWEDWREAGDEVQVLRHDVYGRLLRLRLDHPTIDPRGHEALLQVADEALGADGRYKRVRTNPFTARLVALRGELHQRAGHDDKALDAYDEALTMNRELLQQAIALPTTPDADTGAANGGTP